MNSLPSRPAFLFDRYLRIIASVFSKPFYTCKRQYININPEKRDGERVNCTKSNTRVFHVREK